MRTKGEVMIDLIEQAHNAVVKLSGTDHTQYELNLFLKDIGSEVEIFLKDSVYEGKMNELRFEELIDGLSNCGVSSSVVSTLHKLRRSYNSVKHTPNSNIEVLLIIQILNCTKSAIKEVNSTSIGLTNNPYSITYKRLLWYAGWDHFTSGDTEIHIMIPTVDSVFPPLIDMVNINWKGWDIVKNKFEQNGTLKLGREYIPENVYKSFSEEEDFIDAGIYEGDYRELIIELSKYVNPNIENNLLSFLQRKNDQFAMFASVLFAVVDTINEGNLTENIKQFRNIVENICTYRYAAPRESGYVQQYISNVLKLVFKISFDIRSTITGPLWVTGEKFKELSKNAFAVSDEYYLIIDNQGKLISRL